MLLSGGGMNRHERFLARLEELAREYEVKLRPEEWVQSRLRWEDWERLRPEAVAFAREEIRRRRWRGSRRDVLPEGYGAEDVANQVIGELLCGKSRLPVGFTRERVVGELKRLVHQRVRVLHRLKETKLMRSEWQGVNSKGEPTSVLVGMDDGRGDAQEAFMEREEEQRREGLKEELDEFLAGEPELQGIFRCLCEGLTSSKEIGLRLGIEEKAVVRGRKKLGRRVEEFRRKRARERG